MRVRMFFYFGLAILLVGAYVVYAGRNDVVVIHDGSGGISRPVMHVGTEEFFVKVADTDAERTQGLSGAPALALREGMLFIFPESGRYRFWMKDMHFPIDIIWIGADERVADIAHNLRPESYPESYTPSRPARFVLEVAAGVAQDKNIQIGDPVKFWW